MREEQLNWQHYFDLAPLYIEHFSLEDFVDLNEQELIMRIKTLPNFLDDRDPDREIIQRLRWLIIDQASLEGEVRHG